VAGAALAAAHGVTHIGILVDHTGYAETLRDPGQQSECGRSYIVAPVRLPGGGIQHAKVVWLSGKQGHRALVGSHNLTMSGFNDQLEVTTELRSDVPEHAAALRDLHEAISAIRPELLKDLWARIPRPTVPADAGDADVHVLTSLYEPLAEQLVRHVGPSSALRVVTPFLEPAQLERLATRLGATDVILDIPHEGLDVALRIVAEANAG
jgi:phosphatidylserine/phosphatidylglycerophosphate/cardiolipin synthase-like enzyme